MSKIAKIELFPQFNSRGEKTIKVRIFSDEGRSSWSIAPSGASKSSYEPVYLGYEKILKIFPFIEKNLKGVELEKVDKILEKIGGKKFEKIGGNLSIAISQAVWKLIWKDYEEKLYFPLPLSNVIGGGAHGGFTSIQEFLVFPKKCKSITECVEKNIEVRKYLKGIFLEEGSLYGRNDEGALVVKKSDVEILEIMKSVSKKFSVHIGTDFAANSFYKKGYYNFNGEKYRKEEFVDKVRYLIKKYSLKYVEDPFVESDFESFSELTKSVKKVLIVGDDLFSTNPLRIKKGVKRNAANASIIKPNQIGTISKTLEAIEIIKRTGWTHVVSHRSGETEDPFIGELALRTEAKLMKCSVSGSERFSKWNYLIEKWEKVKKPKMQKIKF